jgi:hypothetical protein
VRIKLFGAYRDCSINWIVSKGDCEMHIVMEYCSPGTKMVSRMQPNVERRTLDWLLEEGEPAVRYLALVDLAGESKDSDVARTTFSRIAKVGWAREILRTQRAGGHWESREDLYLPKYTATIWRLIVLADLGLTAKDKRIRRSCELFLTQYHRPDGGFDTPSSTWSRSELCVTGNLTRTLTRCGYAKDRRVVAGFDWIVDNQMEDGGWHCFYERAFGRGTLDCWEGLSAFAALPKRQWTGRIKRSAERGAEFYLERKLFKQGRRRYLPWLRFHYPVHYYYDILVGLDVITSLGYGDDKRLRPALEILKQKRRTDGTWALDSIHPDLGAGAGYGLRHKPRRFALEQEGRPSKWITLTALRVLKRVQDAS